ncbi:MAG: RDD family protein [candidate division SR1 bacterium]|nr:RDD family protein [candidate division SR1 bacterium]
MVERIQSSVTSGTTTTGTQGYAGFWRRVWANLVDSSIFYLVSFIVLLPFAFRAPNQITLLQYILPVLFLLYVLLMESSSHQGTIGKILMGIKVSDSNGNRISFWRALGRNLAKIISAIPLMIGFMLAGWTSKKQALHDMIAGTFVKKERPAKTGLVLLTIFGPSILATIAVTYFATMLIMLFSGFGGFQTNITSTFDSSSITSSQGESVDERGVITRPGMTDADYEKALNVAPSEIILAYNNTKTDVLPMAAAGPAIIEMDTYDNNFDEPDAPEIELKTYISINIPNLYEGPRPKVVVNHLYNKQGKDILDSNRDEEINSLGTQRNGENKYYWMSQGVFLKKGLSIDKKSISKLEGVITLSLPTSDEKIFEKSYPFTINVE